MWGLVKTLLGDDSDFPTLEIFPSLLFLCNDLTETLRSNYFDIFCLDEETTINKQIIFTYNLYYNYFGM